MNAWPLDEGLIDYVDAAEPAPSEGYDENPAAGLNVIANPALSISGQTVDAATITPDLLENTLQSANGAPANVATGYRAMNFCCGGRIWGPMTRRRASAPGPTSPKVTPARTTIATAGANT